MGGLEFYIHESCRDKCNTALTSPFTDAQLRLYSEETRHIYWSGIAIRSLRGKSNCGVVHSPYGVKET